MPIIILLLILITVIVALIFIFKKPAETLPPTSSNPTSTTISEVASETQALVDPSSEEENGLPAGSLSDWNLILLNPEDENKIEGDLELEKVTFDTQELDKRAGEFYGKMRDAAKAEGINLYLRSGYRYLKTVQLYYDSNIKMHMDAGNSKEEATRLTELYYAIPGHSEHQSGLAADIITTEYQADIHTLDERFAQTDAYKWLMENCADYGFILRYPQDKVATTKINYEPWHYRFVGVEHAKYIMQNGLCLEEYLELLG